MPEATTRRMRLQNVKEPTYAPVLRSGTAEGGKAMVGRPACAKVSIFAELEQHIQRHSPGSLGLRWTRWWAGPSSSHKAGRWRGKRDGPPCEDSNRGGKKLLVRHYPYSFTRVTG
jgi:hypothetical protein